MLRRWENIYGPVHSWRLGISLGIDLLSGRKKACNFDCVYCQLGRTFTYETERKIFVPTEDVIKELELFPGVKLDYITLSGSGEPTLARNLGEVITAVKKLRKEPVAVLTNSLLIYRTDVRGELALADFVVAKLDGFSEDSFQAVNRPLPGIRFEDVLEGIRRFRKEYKKKFALQAMFVDANKDEAGELARLARRIQPDEVHINTPLRKCPVKPLSKEEMAGIKKHFKGIKVISVYEARPKKVIPVSKEDTLKRRGKL